jgi:HEAT repeat protein
VSDKKVVNRLLAARPDKETIDALKTALQDKDWAVRAAAAKGLGRLGRPELGSFLTSSLEDGKPSVRFAAAVAVLRLDTGKAAAARYAQVR